MDARHLIRDPITAEAWQTCPLFRQRVIDFFQLLEFILPILAKEALEQEEKARLQRIYLLDTINSNIVPRYLMEEIIYGKAEGKAEASEKDGNGCEPEG